MHHVLEAGRAYQDLGPDYGYTVDLKKEAA